MAYEQAPIIKAIGNKDGSQDRKNLGRAIRTHELEAAICCCIGNRDIAKLKTMLFLTGNAETKNGNDKPFRVAKKTICERMNLSEQRYYDARKGLEKMGWIHYDSKENVIYVNYNKIYSDYDAYLADLHNVSPEKEDIESEANLMKTEELTLENNEGLHNVSPSDCLNVRHNNIKNNINKSINNKINDGVGAAYAAPPKEFIEMAFEYRNHMEKWIDYLEMLEKWVNSVMSESGLSKESPEYQTMYEELVSLANRCLKIMYGERDSF